jgi:enoyl-CoA hydratase
MLINEGNPQGLFRGAFMQSGTQGLTRIVGSSRAMELILTDRNFTVKEAEQWRLVSRVVGDGQREVISKAVKMASVIASKGRME